MPDLHPDAPDLDRLFDDLARHASTRGHRPGAAAAVRTARVRGRRRVGGLALAAVAGLGAVALPQLVIPSIPGLTADNPDAAPLDVDAVADATEGWIGGWREEREASPGWAAPDCDLFAGALTGAEPLGSSLFVGDQQASAKVLMSGLDSADAAVRTYDAQVQTLDSCSALDGSELSLAAGASGRHYAVDLRTDEAALTDVWVVRTGRDVAVLLAASEAGPAPHGVVDEVAEALASGARSGFTQRSD